MDTARRPGARSTEQQRIKDLEREGPHVRDAAGSARPPRRMPKFSIASGVEVYFADPKSPWQRRTNESTNNPLRQYFPEGNDLSR